jgi:hypothetical protein
MSQAEEEMEIVKPSAEPGFKKQRAGRSFLSGTKVSETFSDAHRQRAPMVEGAMTEEDRTIQTMAGGCHAATFEIGFARCTATCSLARQKPSAVLSA